MKRWMFLLLFGMLLCGCAAEPAWETVSDDLAAPVMATARQVQVELPEEAGAAAFESDNGKLFFSDDYEIAIETLNAGDLDATLRHISGKGRENLHPVQTKQGDCLRYDFVWTGEGDEGTFTGRGTVLDDGVYHYCLSVVRPLEKAENSQVVWRRVFQSFDVSF